MNHTYILHREAPVMFGIPNKTAHNAQYIKLMPGANVLSSEAWEFIKDDDIIQNMMFEKILVLLDEKPQRHDMPLNQAIDITTRPESEAKVIISSTFDEAALLAWMALEKKKTSRKAVIKAIEEQLEEFKDRPLAEKGKN